MQRTLLTPILWIIIASTPVFAQETVYPVRSKGIIPDILTADRMSFVVEKTLNYKLILGFPAGDKADFLPSTKARILVLWLRIENLSNQPVELNTSQFTSTSDDGRTYSSLAPDEAFNRMIAGTGATQKIFNKAVRGASIGRVGSTEDEARDETQRHSLTSSKIPAQRTIEGLIFFEAPEQKKFTVNVRLGDLWLKPFVFSNVKPKT